MKRIKVLLLLVVGMLFLAACGGGTGGGTDGKLNISLDGVSKAPVTVTAANGDEKFNEEVDGSVTIDLAAGSYTVAGGSVEDHTAPSSQNVTVNAGQTSSVSLTYTVKGEGNGGGNGDNGAVEAGVYVNVFPFAISDSAAVTIYAGDIADDDEVASASSGERIELDGGAYTLEVSHEGYTTYTEEFLYEDDTVARFDVTLAQDDSVSGSIARDGVQLDFADEYGAAFDVVRENNDNKNALLLASQTEEQVCVTVSLVDGDGNAVSNAPVTVGITNDVLNSTTWYPGACETDSLSGASADKTVYTDSNGEASFVVEATSSAIADFLSEPVKVIASAVGNDGVARRAEFKVFFTNMSHLYYGATDSTGALDTDTLVQTEERTGNEFALESIVFDESVSSNNSSFFSTWAYSKQPQNAITPVGGPAGGYMNPNPARFPGRVVYTLEDVSRDENGNPLVVFDQCDEHPDELTCIINDVNADNGVVELSPAPGVSVEDLPIEATVKATYIFEVTYGHSGGTPESETNKYEFELKDYTFTQAWHGGYLEIDKYVDQHVLTWRGSEHTLNASSSTFDSDYVATFHITVENPSDSDIYNVTVSDGVPAELGVVVDSLSNGGTYDPVNHTVTWNFNNSPELAHIPAHTEGDDALTFTFDVYARQKPGFCWDGSQGFNNYRVPPMYAGGVTVPEPDPDPNGDGENPAAPSGVAGGSLSTTAFQPDLECYPDPYLVTNGRNKTVTASYYLSDSVEGRQPSQVAYQVDQDESDIWVVRPLFEIEKERKSIDTISVGDSAFYEITVQQIDRFNNGEDTYEMLAAKYPWEFVGETDTTAGTGHNAPESESRNNPYARDVKVTDSFQEGLDFTNASNFTNVDGGLINIGGQVGKTIEWSNITELPLGVEAKATVTLTAQLSSDDENEERPWMNCAFLAAPQLNQPSANKLGVTSYVELPWTQDMDDDHNEIPQGMVAPTGNSIYDCASVRVIPAPETGFMTLTTNGEVKGTNYGPALQDSDLYDGYSANEDFSYVLTAQNSGAGVAEDVVISIDLSNSRVRFNGSARIWTGDGAGNWTPGQNVTLNNADSFVFNPIDVNPAGGNNEHYVRVIVEAVAVSSGEVDMTTELTYDNGPATQSLPLQVVEETSVQ